MKEAPKYSYPPIIGTSYDLEQISSRLEKRLLIMREIFSDAFILKIYLEYCLFALRPSQVLLLCFEAQHWLI